MTMDKTTIQDELWKLWEDLLKCFRKKLKDGDVKASDLAVIRQFLRDNGMSKDVQRLHDYAESLNELENAVDEIPDNITFNSGDYYADYYKQYQTNNADKQ